MVLSYTEVGQGAPLFILHGLFGSADNWRSLALRLGAFFQVYAIDLRNHGKSPHTDTHTYHDLAKDIFALQEHLGISQAHIIGHSMGGKAAMNFALLFPERTASLVVVDIAPRAYSHRHTDIIDALQNLPITQFTQRHEAEAGLIAQGIDDTGVRQFLLKSLVRNESGGFYWRFNLRTLVAEYENIVGSVGHDPQTNNAVYYGPAFFIRGGNSNYVVDGDMPEIQSLFPTAQLVTIPKAGHWVHAEAPEQFLQALGSFYALPVVTNV